MNVTEIRQKKEKILFKIHMKKIIFLLCILFMNIAFALA